MLYRRGPEHPLGDTGVSREAASARSGVQRTFRHVEDRAFLENGFIGRRRELHKLRRRRDRGDRVFVLQGLGGLGKTTLASQFIPQLADAAHTISIWCRRTEGEQDQAEALVGLLLKYARARFGAGFEQVVSQVDREAGDDAVQRFSTFLRAILAQDEEPLVVYLDNLESLLQGPDAVSLNTAPDPNAFGTWRSSELREIGRFLMKLADASSQLFVVASCRYRNDDLAPAFLPVSPLAKADLIRLMAWFPALRRLSTGSRARLATRLSGHPRAAEFMDVLVANAIRASEQRNGDWTPPASSDVEACEREWAQLLEPVLPAVREQIWSDLLLAAIWERVLDDRARRMLFRMTLLRGPWNEELTPCLGEPDDNAEATKRTARALEVTSLLDRTESTVWTPKGPLKRPFFTVHPATAAFVRNRLTDTGDLTVSTHRRIGTYLEERASPDLLTDLAAGYHLFEAHEYQRAYELLGAASDVLRERGRAREGLQVLLPFLSERVQREMSPLTVARMVGTIGLMYLELGEPRRAIEHHERTLAIAKETNNRKIESAALSSIGSACLSLGETLQGMAHYERALVLAREMGDRPGEGSILGQLGNAYFGFGETRRAIEHYQQALVILREIGDGPSEGRALGDLGNGYLTLGDIDLAIEHYEQALDIARRAGDRRGECGAVGNLGNAYRRLGEARRAIQLFEESLAIAREIGDKTSEAYALGSLGNAYVGIGETRRAVEQYEQVLVVARKTGERGLQGLALCNLGHICFMQGEIGHAIQFYEEGLAIGRKIANPRIVDVCLNGLKQCRGESTP